MSAREVPRGFGPRRLLAPAPGGLALSLHRGDGCSRLVIGWPTSTRTQVSLATLVPPNRAKPAQVFRNCQGNEMGSLTLAS